MRGLGVAVVLGALGALSAGCLATSRLDARVTEAREAEGALDTLHDFEVGEVGAKSRIAELEGLYAASGGDSRVSLLLARAWVKLTFEFTLDAHEQALESGDSPGAAYHLLRAQSGYRRAQFYADAWLERRAPGFGAALSDEPALPAWLHRNLASADAAEILLWAGLSRLGAANGARTESNAAAVESARRIGTSLLNQSLALAPATASGFAHVGLALSAALTKAPDLALVERELGLAETAAPGRLLVPLLRASVLACKRHDRRAFEREIERVLSASDPDPALRLENASAKRRARRYLTSSVVGAECFDGK